MADSDSSSNANAPMTSSSEADPQSSPSSSLSNWIPLTVKTKFIHSIPAIFRSVCNDDLDDVFSNYANGFTDTAEFELSILTLIKDLPAALEAFKKLLAYGTFVVSPSKNGKTVFRTQIGSFNDKVRAELIDDTKSYIRWLRHLVKFKKGYESFPKFKKKVEGYFANMTDLWKEFDAMFDPQCSNVGDEKLIQDLTSAGKTSEFSDQEPFSKKGKTS